MQKITTATMVFEKHIIFISSLYAVVVCEKLNIIFFFDVKKMGLGK